MSLSSCSVLWQQLQACQLVKPALKLLYEAWKSGSEWHSLEALTVQYEGVKKRVSMFVKCLYDLYVSQWVWIKPEESLTRVTTAPGSEPTVNHIRVDLPGALNPAARQREAIRLSPQSPEGVYSEKLPERESIWINVCLCSSVTLLGGYFHRDGRAAVDLCEAESRNGDQVSAALWCLFAPECIVSASSVFVFLNHHFSV